jgi:broad specificity phosphatase PhoE
MRVILVRHGETDLNVKGIYRGRADIPLSPRGRAQSRAVGRALRGVRLDGIYTSPLARARDTAAAIAARRPGVAPAVAEEFIDMDFGHWQGLAVDQVREKFPDEFRTWVETPQDARIASAETLEGVRQRALAGLDRLESLHHEGTIAVVSHGVVNKLTLCSVLGLTVGGFWHVKQDTGAISIFEYSRRGAKLFLMNDTCHIGRIREIVEGMAESSTPIGASTDDERRYRK